MIRPTIPTLLSLSINCFAMTNNLTDQHLRSLKKLKIGSVRGSLQKIYRLFNREIDMLEKNRNWQWAILRIINFCIEMYEKPGKKRQK